jgi:hypothetical protein
MLKHGIHGITMESVLSEQGRSMVIMVIMVYHKYLAFHGMGKAWKSMADLKIPCFSWHGRTMETREYP